MTFLNDHTRRFLIQAVASLLSGWLMTLSLPPYDASGVIWVALVPIILGNFLIPVAPPGFPMLPGRRLTAGAMGFWMGLLFFGTTLWWVGYVTIVGTCSLCLYLAFYFAVWNRLQDYWTRTFLPPSEEGIHKKTSAISLTYFKIAALSASTWTLLEWIRGWMFTGLAWNGLAVSQYRVVPILQWASVGGTLLITWWIVFVNVILALGIRRFHQDIREGRGYRRYLDLYLVLIAFMGIHLWGFFKIKTPDTAEVKTLRYAAIQANIPQSEKYAPMNGTQVLLKHMKITNEAIHPHNPELVLWSETACGKVYKTDFELRACVERLQKSGSFDFIMGAIDIDQEKSFNSAFWFPPLGSKVQGSVYHKNHLVLFGEYTPFWDTFPHLGRWFPITRGFEWGDQSVAFDLQRSGVRVAPIICFEDTLSSIVRKANELHPEVLINLTNDAWFETSPGAAQHLANAVFRTVEFDIPMIRCTNSGITCQINQKGIIDQSLQDSTGNRVGIEGALIGDLHWTPSTVTPYERYGNWVVWVSLLIFGAGIWKELKSRLNQRQKRQF
jgi:apolipoprotein N-acyltransferase